LHDILSDELVLTMIPSPTQQLCGGRSAARPARVLLLLLLTAWALLVAGCSSAPSTPTPVPTPVDPLTLGQQTFATWCVPCHGAEGQGFVNALNAPALNADGEAYKLTDAAILAAIVDGGAASGGAMVPLGNSLSDEQESAVLLYIHTLWTTGELAIHVHGE